MTYLNTATLGLPPRRGREALATALREWAEGTADAAGYDADVEAAGRRTRRCPNDDADVDRALDVLSPYLR